MNIMLPVGIVVLFSVAFSVSNGQRSARDIPSSSSTCGRPSVPNKARFNADGSPATTRIVGGLEIAPHSIPWIVSLRTRGGKHFCGGTLIPVDDSSTESDIVLTASHCVEGVPFNMLDVVLGAHYLSKEEEGEEKVRPAFKGVLKHDAYNSPVRYANDIALIKLERPVQFSDTIRPACLPELGERVVDNSTGIVAGWGHLRQNGKLSETLQQVLVPVVGPTICAKTYGTRLHSDTMLCAGHQRGGKDSCQNDSGGPLFFQRENGAFVLHGVVSFGQGCAKASTPGVYARVSAQVDWIKGKVKEMRSVGKAVMRNESDDEDLEM